MNTAKGRIHEYDVTVGADWGEGGLHHKSSELMSAWVLSLSAVLSSVSDTQLADGRETDARYGNAVPMGERERKAERETHRERGGEREIES